MTESTFPPYLQPHTTTCKRGHETLRSLPGKPPCPVCARKEADTGLTPRREARPGANKPTHGLRFGGGRIGYGGRGAVGT